MPRITLLAPSMRSVVKPRSIADRFIAVALACATIWSLSASSTGRIS